MIDENAQFGLAIKNARLDYGLTQEELSEQAQANSERTQLIRILDACTERDIHIILCTAKAMLNDL